MFKAIIEVLLLSGSLFGLFYTVLLSMGYMIYPAGLIVLVVALMGALLIFFWAHNDLKKDNKENKQSTCEDINFFKAIKCPCCHSQKIKVQCNSEAMMPYVLTCKICGEQWEL